MKRLLLLELDIILYGILFHNTWAWRVTMPNSVHGLHKSCLVIPCSFSYSAYPPTYQNRIVWYQYVDRGYPAVFDSWNPASVTDRYKGRTSLYNHKGRVCSLLIEDLSLSHDGDRIYAWVDPENIGWRTYKFYDVNTLIHIDSSAEKPIVDISGGGQIGDSITVQCTTYHTCPYKPPSLSLSGIEKGFGKEDRLVNRDIGNGKWEIKLIRVGVVQSERQDIQCSVRHSGGLTASTTKTHSAKCTTEQPSIGDPNTRFLEGVEQDIVCSVTYTCSSSQPQILWNGGNLPGRTSYINIQGLKHEAKSTLKFIAKANDNGKTVTCETRFKGASQRVQITLRVKRSKASLDWSFTMPSTITGVRGSCVVIPCNYKFKNSPSFVNVKWYQFYNSNKSLVYGDSSQYIMDKFKGKTSLNGSSNDKSCSLKIQPLENNLNQERLFPWMDQNSIDTYNLNDFKDETISLEVTDIVEKPKGELLGIAKVGEPVTLSCSVIHTCPPSPPTLSLSLVRGFNPRLNNELFHNEKWKTTKQITWVVEENDNSVTCTVSYAGGQTSKTEISINPLCTIDQAQITPNSETEFLEGVEQDIVCSVIYMCSKDRPYITWTGKQLPGSTFDITMQEKKYKAFSTLKFIPKASDHGKIITCQADFKGNVQSVDITLRVQRSMGSLDWSFTMPSAISGVRGSCVIIPCNYEFKTLQHSRTNVKWYKLSSTDYPLVYDQSANNIITEFKGKTSLFGSPNDKNCSLKIQPLEMQHSKERLFPWMDPNSIESYHSKDFDHVTVSLEVTDIVEVPKTTLLGITKVGESVTLSCSVVHTCPPTPPTLSLSITRGNSTFIHTPVHDGKWKVTKKITMIVEENDKSVTCTVSYAGGQTSKDEIIINPLCGFHNPVINPSQEEIMEGIEKIFTCTVQHTCQKDKPNIIWNYKDMPVSVETHKDSSYTWNTVSTLKFKASRDDHGKTLTCKSETSEGETSDHVTLKVKRGMFSLDWTYSMPSKITGLQSSCLVIPCSFEFTKEDHSNVEVKWYQYAKNQFTLVYGSDVKNIVNIFFDKTRLLGLASENNCSLEIKELNMHHNEKRLYPWMDPTPVEKFHKENYYDKSIVLTIKEYAEKPKLSIIGVARVGEQVTVSCSVLHTCPSNPPNLIMGKELDTDVTSHNPVQDGFWEMKRVHTFKIKEEEKIVQCKATFYGGQTSEAQIDLNAQCTYTDINIDPEVANVVEGVGNNFTCTVFHSCKSQPLNFTWNYKELPETVGTKKGSSLNWATFSNVLFIASLEDDGKKLTCTAAFPGGAITTSIVLQVQRYVPKFVDPFENDTFHILEANVAPRITALTHSCVVIPCTFKMGDMPITRLRGLWYTSTGEYVYHTGKSYIMDNFKGRTRLLGMTDEQNCTLEIENIQSHDNGPFCFRAEKGTDKYSFNHSCVFIIMKATPDKPVISALPEEMEPGKRFTIHCSVTHTCSSHPPNITWNVRAAKVMVSHVEKSAGKWETTSTITFIPTGYEEEENLICRATFWKGKNQESAVILNVKRFEGPGMGIIGLYIILALVTLLLLCAGIIVCRRRAQKKTTDEETPERRRSFWTQISRRHDGAAAWLNSTTRPPPRPPKPERRGSNIWSRLSRRGLAASADVRVQYKVNNTSAAKSAGY